MDAGATAGHLFGSIREGTLQRSAPVIASDRLGISADLVHFPTIRIRKRHSPMVQLGHIGQYSHVFRPGLFRATRVYWLNGGILHWRIGKKTGHLAVGDVARLHLHPPPRGTSVGASCLLVETSGRSHWIADHHWFGWSVGERHRLGLWEYRAATFRGLVFTLARRVRKANPEARFLHGAGLTPFSPDKLHGTSFQLDKSTLS